MSKNYVIGFPRIGEKRELKKVLEDYWAKKVDFSEVKYVAENLRKRHWTYQKEAKIDFIASNDFSLYDNMLDSSILLGAIPKRFQHLKDEELYFAMARGNQDCVAMEMTKWFNTNYHYIVPEISKDTTFKLNSKKVIEEYKEALELGINTKINLKIFIRKISGTKTIRYCCWSKIKMGGLERNLLKIGASQRLFSIFTKRKSLFNIVRKLSKSKNQAGF